MFRPIEVLREREMRLEAVDLTGLGALDVAFTVDAEMNAERAVAANPGHAPSVALHHPHRDVEDIGVARKRPPGLGKSIQEVLSMAVRSGYERRRVGDRSQVAERGSDGQVIGLAFRLAEIRAATAFPIFLRRPFPVEAEGFMVLVTCAIEPDPVVRDLRAHAAVPSAIGERDALDVLDVLQQSFHVFSDLFPLFASEITDLGKIVRVTHWGSPCLWSGIAPDAARPLNCC
jgi:hypothetical protein